jgi:hypothetical protein
MMPARFALYFAAVVLFSAPPAASAQFLAQFDRTSLKVGKHEFPRLRLETPWHWHREFRHRGLRYRVDGNSVIQTKDDAARKVLARVSVSDAANLRWVGANEDVAFLIPYHTETDAAGASVLLQLRVLRLDLKTMRWIAPLDLSLQPPEENKILHDREAAAVRKWREKIRKSDGDRNTGEPSRESVLGDLLVTDRGAFVLTCLVMLGQNSFEELLGCEISYFAQGSEKPSWKKWIDGSEGPPQAAVLVASTDWDERADQPLTRLPSGVLVCVPYSDELLCLDDMGRELWRLPRIWEYARGFGSAVGYSFHIGRFGVLSEEAVAREAELAEESDIGATEETLKTRKQEIDEQIRTAPALRAERSARFYKDYDAWIEAGPVRVDSADRAPNEARLFVAVGTMPKQHPPTNAYNVVECVIYEVTVKGEVVAMLKTPRPIGSRMHFAVSSALIWGSEQGNLLRMASAGQSPELICPVKWYREYELGPNKSAPFVVERNRNVVCANESHLFRSGGSYDMNEREHVHRFLINAVDLESGLDRDLILSLPYDGKLPAPMSYKKEPGQVRVLSMAYAVAVQWLEIDGDILRVVVSADESMAELEFDVRSLRKSVDVRKN